MNSTLLKRLGISLASLGTTAALLTACSRHTEQPPDEPKTAKSVIEEKAGATGVTCAAHAAPKELCFICDASLREEGRLWCKEHNRYEDRCWECHPELQDKNRLYCKEHSLYEDECFLCHPELKGKGKPAAASGPALMCAEHGV